MRKRQKRNFLKQSYPFKQKIPQVVSHIHHKAALILEKTPSNTFWNLFPSKLDTRTCWNRISTKKKKGCVCACRATLSGDFRGYPLPGKSRQLRLNKQRDRQERVTRSFTRYCPFSLFFTIKLEYPWLVRLITITNNLHCPFLQYNTLKQISSLCIHRGLQENYLQDFHQIISLGKNHRLNK